MPKIPPLSVAEASEETGIPKRTVQAAITRGDLKAHKLPGRTAPFLIDRRDLDRWIAGREPRAS
jgi:excisionase family DNA binding protein